MNRTASPSFATWESAVAWLRSQLDKRQLVLDCYYDDPLLSAATRYWESEEWRSVRQILARDSGLALDVGAGRGIASFALARDGFNVTALEPDGSALVGAQAIRALAHESGLPITVCEEFSERLPFADAQFDVVFARAVLHHTRDLSAACRELFRVLKPGGVLIAVREHVISSRSDLPAFLRVHPLHNLYGGENAFLLAQYRQAIEGAGFVMRSVLAPMASPINYAPHTMQSLRREIAQRLGRGIPALSGLVARLLALPGVWPLLLPLLERVDHRPGRLYSFVCRRP